MTWNCPPGLHAASWWTPLHIAGTALTALYVVAVLCAVVAFRRRLRRDAPAAADIADGGRP